MKAIKRLEKMKRRFQTKYHRYVDVINLLIQLYMR